MRQTTATIKPSPSSARFVLGILLSIFSLSLQAQELALSGELSIGGAADNYGRPTAGNSHLHFVIDGAAAKAMYEALAAKAEKDDCSGFIRKSEGHLNCYAKTIEQEYSCSFALNIRQNRLEANAPTCQH